MQILIENILVVYPRNAAGHEWVGGAQRSMIQCLIWFHMEFKCSQRMFNMRQV